ncbi:hypothetical protein DFJ77DRAFT_440120 [Powellomyces hirtus]|nr:hypothetical protein DFJ77DRAFT_440120 [Powellomyces hirtus]
MTTQEERDHNWGIIEMAVSQEDTILAMWLFAGAVLVGMVNETYVVKRDIIDKRGRRGFTAVISQSIMLFSYVASMFSGYSYCVGNQYHYEVGSHFASLSFLAGTYILMYVVEGFLPAVQMRMAYNKRWNYAARSVSAVVFSVAFIGNFVTTVMIAHKQSILKETEGLGRLLTIRSAFFTVWLAYAPAVAGVISILVIRMVIAVKKTMADNRNANSLLIRGLSPSDPYAILDRMKWKAFISASVAIPVTTAIAFVNLLPYSVMLDAGATLYAACFCAWLLYTMHIIRVVVQYSPQDSNQIVTTRITYTGLSGLQSANSPEFTRSDANASAKKKAQVVAAKEGHVTNSIQCRLFCPPLRFLLVSLIGQRRQLERKRATLRHHDPQNPGLAGGSCGPGDSGLRWQQSVPALLLGQGQPRHVVPAVDFRLPPAARLSGDSYYSPNRRQVMVSLRAKRNRHQREREENNEFDELKSYNNLLEMSKMQKDVLVTVANIAALGIDAAIVNDRSMTVL